MTASQPSLFAPGWEQEPCGDADERAAVPRAPRPRRLVGTRHPHALGRRVRTVRLAGEWL